MWNKILLTIGLLFTVAWSHAGDVDLNMTTSDGSTHVSFIDDALIEVSSVTSDGDAFFSGVNLSDNSRVKLQDALQSDTTFYISSASVKNELRIDGGGRVGGVIARDYSTVSINNSSSETSIFSFTIPADLMGTNRTVRIYIFGTTVIDNTGGASSRTLHYRLKLGATTVIASLSGGFARTSDTRRWIYKAAITNDKSASAQKAFHQAGNIRNANASGFMQIETGTATEDTTSDRVVDVTMQLGAASADFTFTKEAAYAVIE